MENAKLIRQIDRYCKKHKVPVTRFGTQAINDPALYSSLKEGRELRRSTEAKVLIALSKPPEKKG